MSKISINHLPVATWNHLRVNEAFADIPSVTGEAVVSVSGDAVVSVSDHSDMRTGMGAEYDALIKSCAKCETISTKDASASVRFDITADGVNALAYHVDAAPGQFITVVQVIDGEDGSELLLSTKLEAKASSHVRLIQYIRGGAGICNDIGTRADEAACVELFQIFDGSGDNRSGVYTRLDGKAAQFISNTGYRNASGLLDMNYVSDHFGRRTNTVMNFGGSLDGGAVKVLRGTIDFKKGCSGAVGNEKEEVLMLSDECVNRTVPLILCAEEDVEGNHGASIGQADEEMLYYMGTRGLSREEAIRMLSVAKLESVIAKIDDEKLRREFSEHLKGSSDE